LQAAFATTDRGAARGLETLRQAERRVREPFALLEAAFGQEAAQNGGEPERDRAALLPREGAVGLQLRARARGVPLLEQVGVAAAVGESDQVRKIGLAGHPQQLAPDREPLREPRGSPERRVLRAERVGERPRLARPARDLEREFGT
jgi:hypothetical protein